MDRQDDEHAARTPRVVYLDHSSRPGGGQLSLARFLEQSPSARTGRLLVLEGGMLAERAAAAGVPVTVPPPSRVPGAAVLQLLRALRGAPPSLVLANSMKSAFYLAFVPKGRHRFVYYMREDLSPEWLKPPRRPFILGFTMRRFDAFVANSRWTESTLPKGLARSRPHVVAYPVSGVTTATAPATPRTGPIRILSLSRLSEWKGVDVLVDAAAELARRGLGDDFRITIAGDDIFKGDPYVQRLRDAAAASGATIDFTGHVDDVGALLASHDVLASCSRVAEPFGQVIVQGLASGMVTVATAMGGPREVLTDGEDGVLVPPGDARTLADALARLHEDRERMHRVAVAGTRTARRYLDGETVRGLERALRELAARLSGSRRP